MVSVLRVCVDASTEAAASGLSNLAIPQPLPWIDTGACMGYMGRGASVIFSRGGTHVCHGRRWVVGVCVYGLRPLLGS